jgi:hypothetical protein
VIVPTKSKDFSVLVGYFRILKELASFYEIVHNEGAVLWPVI